MAKKQLNAIGIVFAAAVLVGFVLVIVGMCIGIISSSLGSASESVGLFDEVWEQYAKMQDMADAVGSDATIPSRTFTLIAFIITLIGGVAVLANAVLKLLGKNVPFLGLVAGAVTVIGAILILVAGLVLAGQFKDMTGGLSEVAGATFSAGAGIWLGFIGGLVAGAAGILSSLKMFNK